jgi:hypothetical protein
MISFDPYFAKQFGVNEAIIFERVKTLIQRNIHNCQNFYLDNYWADLNPHVVNNFLFFMNSVDIDFAISNLVKRNVLIEKRHDNIVWHTISEKYFNHNQSMV